MPLKPGDKAPDFTLLDQDGQPVKLSKLKGRKVLVYFYPKADTPGCTQQSCGLRDVSSQVGDTAIVGISPDKPAKQKKFDDKYGAWGEKSMYGKKYQGIIRSAFLVDERGKVQAAWPKVSPKDTPKNLLHALGAEA